MSSIPQLHLEIGSQTWTIQDGDVIGRFGNVAAEILKNSDVLSRQHLQVQLKESGWTLTLLPNARNTTRIDGRVMTAGQSVKLGPIHDITIHELQFRLRQRGVAVQAPLLEDHPVALLNLDAVFQIQNFNATTQRLFPQFNLHDLDFSTLLDSQSAIALKIALSALPSGETSSLDVKFTGGDSRHFRLSATLKESSYLVSLIDVTAEKLRQSNASQQLDKFDAGLSDCLASLLSLPAFQQGDFAAILPWLAQLGASLLPEASITFWLSDRTSVLHPSATAGEIYACDQTPISRDLFPPYLSESLPLSYLHEDGALLIRLFSTAEASSTQKTHANLLNSLFVQVLTHASSHRLLQKFHQKEESQKIELSQAKRYISRLLPQQINEAKIQVQYHYEPCGDLGGDTFGYQWLNNDVFCMYLVDVAGHGIGSSLLAVSIVNHLRLSIERQEPWLNDPALWLKELNQTFQMEKHSGLTWTIWCGVYQSSKRELAFASAGHPPAFLMDRGQVKELTTQGPVMGVLPNLEFQSAKVKLTDKAKLLLYTDGVYEFPLADGSTQSYDAYLQAASHTLPMTDGECRYLYNHAAALCYGSEFPDDFTLLCLRFK